MKFSIIQTWFVVLLWALGVGALAGALYLAWRRTKWVWLAAPLSTGFLALATLGSVNAYFAYVPSFHALFAKNQSVTVHELFADPKDAKGAPSSRVPHAKGEVREIEIPGTISGFRARSATLYIPPVLLDDPNARVPVVMLFHGTPGSPVDWTRGGGAVEIADNWAARHSGVAPMLLMPDINGSARGDTECVDGKQGKAETYLSTDVPNFAVENLHVRAEPKAWAVGGLSEGGYCGVMLALRHPDRFGTFLSFGGDSRPTTPRGFGVLFDGSSHEIARQVLEYDVQNLIARHDITRDLAGWFVAGTGDGHEVALGKRLAEEARAKGINANASVVQGGAHDFSTWKRCLASTFPAVMERMSAFLPPPA